MNVKSIDLNLSIGEFQGVGEAFFVLSFIPGLLPLFDIFKFGWILLGVLIRKFGWM